MYSSADLRLCCYCCPSPERRQATGLVDVGEQSSTSACALPGSGTCQSDAARLPLVRILNTSSCAVCYPTPMQHTAFMALTLLSEVNSACHLTRKMLGTAASASGAAGTSASAAAEALAAVDRVTFAAFRWG